MFLFLSGSSSFALDASKSFLKANEAYEKGEFKEAAELYETILKEIKNGILYFNLGNCYFKQGKIGYALSNYLRAKKYDPNNSDINDNIKYLRTITKDKVENKGLFNFVYRVFFYYDTFNIKEFFYIFIFFNVTFFLVLAVRFLYKKTFLNWLKNVILLLLLISAAGCLLNYKVFFYDLNGVIVRSEISVRSGSSLNDTVIFNLHEGTEFKVTDENGDWLKIKLLDNKRGWILKSVVELI
jgi:tetratricopeptide (TPR) repeat protein